MIRPCSTSYLSIFDRIFLYHLKDIVDLSSTVKQFSPVIFFVNLWGFKPRSKNTKPTIGSRFPVLLFFLAVTGSNFCLESYPLRQARSAFAQLRRPLCIFFVGTTLWFSLFKHWNNFFDFLLWMTNITVDFFGLFCNGLCFRFLNNFTDFLY